MINSTLFIKLVKINYQNNVKLSFLLGRKRIETMDNELYPLEGNTQKVDSFELLIRFLHHCKKNIESNQFKSNVLSSADLVTAVYYYRRYPNVNEFIEKFLKDNSDYFQLQWVRSTWTKLSSMTDPEISDLVINQVSLIDNSEEEQ